MTDPRTQAAKDFGVVYTPAIVPPGQFYWRIIKADGPLERGGNANIYVDVLDEQGQRLTGIPIEFYWNGGAWESHTEQKPGEPDQGTNMPMSAGGNAYGVAVAQGLSDSVFGMGLVPYESHKSYQIVFQRAKAGIAAPPTEPPGQGMSAREAIERAQNYFAQGQQLLDSAREQLP